MAPKRNKAKARVRPTAEDDNEAELVAEPAPKRRKATGRRSTAVAADAPAEDALASGDVDGAAGPSSGGPTVEVGAKQEKEHRVDNIGRKVIYRPNASQDVRTRIQRAMPGQSM